MSEPRVAVVSAHGRVHKPTCPEVARLKSPRSIFVLPWHHPPWVAVGEDGEGFGGASCCGRYFRSREIVVWAEGADAEPMPGWWAQWCVTHDSSLYEFGERVGDVCDDSRAGSIGFCVWHPQGAFIPEVEAPK